MRGTWTYIKVYTQNSQATNFFALERERVRQEGTKKEKEDILIRILKYLAFYSKECLDSTFVSTLKLYPTSFLIFDSLNFFRKIISQPKSYQREVQMI